jgi:cyclic pyranopterin phosphate synthase
MGKVNGRDADFSHLDNNGRAKMVNVSHKDSGKRVAAARGYVQMDENTLNAVISGGIKKGDVLSIAQTAGIMGAKKTAALIPLCHPLFLSGVEMDFKINRGKSRVEIEAHVFNTGQTGVEMEALTAVAVAGLTIYDMCKALDKNMLIGDIRLTEKSGGKSGVFRREGEEKWQK